MFLIILAIGKMLLEKGIHVFPTASELRYDQYCQEYKHYSKKRYIQKYLVIKSCQN